MFHIGSHEIERGGLQVLQPVDASAVLQIARRGVVFDGGIACGVPTEALLDNVFFFESLVAHASESLRGTTSIACIGGHNVVAIVPTVVFVSSLQTAVHGLHVGQFRLIVVVKGLCLIDERLELGSSRPTSVSIKRVGGIEIRLQERFLIVHIRLVDVVVA